MKLHRPAVITLALFVGLPALGVGNAEAAFIRRSAVKVKTDSSIGSTYHRVTTTVSGDAGAVATVTAQLESDGGEEDLPLVESDAWMHGAATIAALPAADADLTVTLYDNASASLISFSGTLGKDGSVTLTADTAPPTDGEACVSRTGCAEETTRADALDIELLAAEVFAASKGYDVALDLAGADTYGVAYATITVTEPGAPVCVATDEKGNCLKWEDTKEVSTRSEVFWDEVGSVWEADATLAHEGLVELKVKVYSAEGEKLETVKSKLGAPWRDDGEGVGALATDEDPLTRVALHKHYGALQHWHAMSVASEGWTASDALPVDAEVELTNGDTITIPVNSYQRPGHTPTQSEASILFSLLDTAGRIVIDDGDGGGATFDVSSLEELRSPVCSDGFCVVVSETGRGSHALSVTAYGPIATDLPDRVEVELTAFDASGDTSDSETVSVAFDDEITAVFASEVSFAGDPVGLGLSGKVKLLGEPNRRGKQETLAKGKFFGDLTRDGDGDLELAGADKDGVVSSGGIVRAGEAITLGADREGAPPPVVASYAVDDRGGVSPRLDIVARYSY
ncbi:MAG: hypothetical protein V4850_12115 [Myxococcota bacterium]